MFDIALMPGNREGYPDIRTVDYWLGENKAERFPQSRFISSLRVLVALFNWFYFVKNQ